ncbi:DUF1573 domain-containing protein [bacterium]|nr:DUF1573 domain-containing protein [bacterium]
MTLSIRPFVTAAFLFALLQPLIAQDPTWREVKRDSKWCGAKALYLVADKLGVVLNEQQAIAEAEATGAADGYMTIGQLESVAKSLGLAAAPVRATLDWLATQNQPIITLHRFVDRGGKVDYHYMVYLGPHPDGYEIVDPFFPSRLEVVDKKYMDESWTETALIVARSPDQLPSVLHFQWISTIVLLSLAVCSVAYMIVRMRWPWRPTASMSTLVLLLFAAGCDSRNAEIAQSPPLSVHFDSFNHDAGCLFVGLDSLRIVHSFKFKNEGTKAIQIEEVRRSCSCTSTEFTKEPINPGDSGTVDLTVDLDSRRGEFAVQGWVRFTEHEELFPLRIVAFVVDRPTVSPEIIDFGRTKSNEQSIVRALVQVPLKPGAPKLTILHHDSVDGRIIYTFTPIVMSEVVSDALHRRWPVAQFYIDATLKAAPAFDRIQDALTISFSEPYGEIKIRASGDIIDPSYIVTPSIIECLASNEEKRTGNFRIEHIENIEMSVTALELARGNAKLSWSSRRDDADHRRLFIDVSFEEVPDELVHDQLLIRLGDASKTNLKIPIIIYPTHR